jgi:hypothetical protein
VVLSSPINLSDADKLEALRRLDQFRSWHSLEEKRYCLVCEKIITGRQIQITGGTRGNGPLRLSCLTERCHSIPMDWVLPTDEIMANLALREAERSSVAALHFDRDARENSSATAALAKAAIGSRLRKLALRLKRSA